MPAVAPAPKAPKPLYEQKRSPVPMSLHTGDTMTQEEFMAVYATYGEDQHAELIEGEVFLLNDDTSFENHGEPDADISGWIAVYRSETPGLTSTGPATTLLDGKNVVEPDCQMRIRREYGGNWSLEGENAKGAPELACEVSYTSRSIDVCRKKRAYERNGVQEYLVFRTEDRAVDWWELRDGVYVPLPVADDGSISSRVFPGLVLDVPALLQGDLKAMLDRLRANLCHGAHAEFCKDLEKRRQSTS
jgi:Uma2 family endonuclease